MEDLRKLAVINRLKEIYRASHVGERQESSAEHTWSCLVLADCFLDRLPPTPALDRLKVFELLLYHDLVEIEVGDTPLDHHQGRKGKEERERLGAERLSKKLPQGLGTRYRTLFEEYEAYATPESRFAKAIDALDVVLQELDHKEDWKGWTKGFLLEKKHALFKEFPALEKEFLTLLDFLEKEGYLDQ